MADFAKQLSEAVPAFGRRTQPIAAKLPARAGFRRVLKTFLMTENESTYIPLGATHRLANPGKLPALLVEIQSGAYLGEDDIVRYEDDFNRDKEGP